MTPPSPQDRASIRTPHPLAVQLIARFERRRGRRVLEYASGSGRNAAAMARAGLEVVAISDAEAGSANPLQSLEGTFAAALSTHGLLHGTRAGVTAAVAAIAGCLETGGFLYATFGSVRDARFGTGQRLDDGTYAPLEGDETGVPHAFFDRENLTHALQSTFEIETLDERAVDDIAGPWAHERPLRAAVHWFVTARRR
jgi:hypothetical protein